MTTISQRILAGTDDAHDTDDGGFPGYSDTEAFIYTGYISPRNVFTGLRFTDLGIPSGATINSAKITLTDDSAAGGNHSVKIAAEDSGASPATFSSGSTPTGRTQTTASVSWSVVEPAAEGTLQSPDFASVVQELVDSYGGITHLVVILESDTADTNNTWYSYDGDTAKAPLLDLEYTAGAGGGTILLQMGMQE